MPEAMRPDLQRVMRLSAADVDHERVPENDTNVHFPTALVRAVVERYTAPGGTVLDPFAGFGTTLVVCEELGRPSLGVELLAERVAVIRRRLRSTGRVIHGDARRLEELGVGEFDLCLTSPPYMNAVDHPQNPLTGYATLDGHYPTYLDELTAVFLAVARHLRPGGHLVINAANVRVGGTVTPLAFDLVHALAPHLTFRGETYLLWDRLPELISGDYCLVFARGGGGPDDRPSNDGVQR